MRQTHYCSAVYIAEFDTSEIEALRESESERAKRLQIYVSEGIMTTDSACLRYDG